MSKYFINYHTGAGDFTITGTLEEAQAAADQGAGYTQESITICDEIGEEVSRRPWWGVEYNEDEVPEENPICFGNFGYYGDWADA